MKGQEAFNHFYETIYGSRWQPILSALQKPELQVMRLNKWTQKVDLNSSVYFENLPNCKIYDGESLSRDESSGLLPFYVMDPASVFVAKALTILPGAQVLDMCAAPGGKSLIFAEHPNIKKLVCNEFSANRRERLKKVIQQYVPRDKRESIFVTGQDSTRIGLKFSNQYDSILLDAPCSGERHLIENAEELSQWSIKRTQGLAQKQYAMLCSALMCAKSEAHIVYSTCALSPFENDGVIEKLIKKKSEQFRVIPVEQPHRLSEKTQFGWQFLPDQCGFGPMYFCVLQKI